MNKKSLIIKDIIEYLTHVSNDEEIGPISQEFFLSIPKLNKVLNDYLIHFKNKDSQNKAVKFNLEVIKRLSFSKSKESYEIVKDLSRHNKVTYSKQEHNNYSYMIHSHLIQAFKEKLGIKKVKENKRITIRDKKVYDLIKTLNLKIDFLRDDCSPKDFVNVIIGTLDKNIYLNIKNRSFHYLLNKLRDYFYNFSITSVANTNKIHGSTGTLLNSRNLSASKSYSPKHKDAIDEVFKNFK